MAGKAEKIYTSVLLNHRIGNGIRFQNGIFKTSKVGEQKTIESDKNYGTLIFESKSADQIEPKIEP